MKNSSSLFSRDGKNQLKEMTAKELINSFKFHDAQISDFTFQYPYKMDIHIELDEAWNSENQSDFKGFRVEALHEILSFQPDQMNVIGTISHSSSPSYSSELTANPVTKPIKLSIDLICGGQLSLICEDCFSIITK